jgi:WD40 repeat protein
VVSGSYDGTARVWHIKNGEPVQDLNLIKTGHRSVHAVSYSPKARMIATGGYNNSGIEIWDAKTGELLSTIELDFAVWSLTWTSDERKLFAGSSDASIRIFDTATSQQIAVLEGHTNTVYSLTLFPNDRLLASTSWDDTACLWNLDTNLQVGPPLQHENFVRCAAFSADGKLLSTACHDKNAYVWDIQIILREAGLEDLLSIPDVSINLITTRHFIPMAVRHKTLNSKRKYVSFRGFSRMKPANVPLAQVVIKCTLRLFLTSTLIVTSTF